MDIVVDPTSETPIYQQIRDRVVEAIADGRLRAGDALVSVRRLAAAFGINPATVGKAYDELRHEGLVTTTRKSGSSIARDPSTGTADERFVVDWRLRLRTVLAEAHAQGVPAADVLRMCAETVEGFATDTLGATS